MASISTDVDEIRRRMAQIRCELHEDVREVVASAEAVTDWTRYIRLYPWSALAASFVVGYVIVPRRHRSIPSDLATQTDVDKIREAVEAVREVQSNKKGRKGLLATVFSLAAPLALRAAQGYAAQFVENWMHHQHSAQGMQGGATFSAPPGAGGAPGERRRSQP